MWFEDGNILSSVSRSIVISVQAKIVAEMTVLSIKEVVISQGRTASMA